MTLVDVDFIGNAGGSCGGGGRMQRVDSVELANVRFIGNSAGTSGGGGLCILNSLVEAEAVEFRGNFSNTAGGAINFAGAGMKIHNSIFWNNQNSNGIGSAQASIWSLNAGADVQNSMVQGFTAGELGGSGNFDGSVNPQFIATTSPLAAPTTSGDLHLREFSPVKDAGNNTLIAGFDLDLDGVARIFNGTVDLGPYEFGSGILFRDRFEQGGAP